MDGVESMEQGKDILDKVVCVIVVDKFVHLQLNISSIP